MSSHFSERAICGNCTLANEIIPTEDNPQERKLNHTFQQHQYNCTQTADFRLRPHNNRCDVIHPGTDLLAFTHK